MKINLLIISLILVFTLPLFAQNHSFSVYEIPSGNEIRDLDFFNNHLYVASESGVLSLDDNANWTVYTTNDGLPTNDVKSLGSSSSTIYAGTNNQKVARYSGNGNWSSQSYNVGPPFNDISAIYIRANGDEFYGTDQGSIIEKLHGQGSLNVIEYSASGATLGMITDIHETKTGIFIPYSTNGLVLDARSTSLGIVVPVTTATGLPSNTVLSAAMSNNISYDGTDQGLNIADFNVPTILPPKLEVITVSTPGSQLPSNRIQALAVDKNNVLWIGTDKGLVQKDGTTWTIYTTSNSNLPSNNITALVLDGEKIWLATGDGHVATFGNPVGIVEPIDLGFTMGANYPNPFENITTIPIQINQPQKIGLIIYDAMGKIVYSQSPKHTPKGNHYITVNTNYWSSGIYYIKLQGDQKMMMQKMTLLR